MVVKSVAYSKLCLKLKLLSEPTTTTKLDSQSTVVRLLRGINPWSSGDENSGVYSLTFAQTDKEEPKLLAVCRDHRICVWSCKNQKVPHNSFSCPQIIYLCFRTSLLRINFN